MWIFESSTGKLYDPLGNIAGNGYAGGDCGLHPEGINNPNLQDQHNIGPTPEGLYTIGTPVEGTHLGPFAMPLTPDANNNMFGRSGFYMHGDTNPSGHASDGCIIMPRTVRNAVWASSDHRLQVIAVKS
jgi:hypothetical protein